MAFPKDYSVREFSVYIRWDREASGFVATVGFANDGTRYLYMDSVPITRTCLTDVLMDLNDRLPDGAERIPVGPIDDAWMLAKDAERTRLQKAKADIEARLEKLR